MEIRAEDLMKRYQFDPHEENGLYIERHYDSKERTRPASGCIYYYVRPGEQTQFHKIDCDEYWCFNSGCTLELWIIGLDGKLRVEYCGTDEGSEVTIRFAAGEIFASKLNADAPDGAFITCITVPRFTYDGFEMYEKETIIQMYPETEGFWRC